MSSTRLLPIVASFCLMSNAASLAAELPRWELGVGIGALSIPDYRGSDERDSYLLPLPYLVYRGEDFRIDRDGLRGDLVETARVKVDLSLSAGPPTKSDDNAARVGMPDIDPTIELGPSLKLLLAADGAGERFWSLQFPLRAVFATDLSHIEHIGWVFSPHLNYEARNLGRGWDLEISAGPLYASGEYHDYFYTVEPHFAAPGRPAFAADPGYSGFRLTATLVKRFPSFWVGAFARYDSLRGAAFDDSPLLRRDDSLMAGVGIAWIVAQSRERTEAGRRPW